MIRQAARDAFFLHALKPDYYRVTLTHNTTHHDDDHHDHDHRFRFRFHHERLRLESPALSGDPS